MASASPAAGVLNQPAALPPAVAPAPPPPAAAAPRKRSQRICVNCKDYIFGPSFLIGTPQHVRGTHFKPDGKTRVACPFVSGHVSKWYNAWGYLTKRQKEEQRKKGMNMDLYNAVYQQVCPHEHPCVEDPIGSSVEDV